MILLYETINYYAGSNCVSEKQILSTLIAIGGKLRIALSQEPYYDESITPLVNTDTQVADYVDC